MSTRSTPERRATESAPRICKWGRLDIVLAGFDGSRGTPLSFEDTEVVAGPGAVPFNRERFGK